MKSYNHNLTEDSLLLNSHIYYNVSEEIIVEVKTPVIKDTLNDQDFNLFISLLFMKTEDYQKIGLRKLISTPAEGFLALLRENKGVREKIQPSLEKFLVGSVISVDGIKVNEYYLTEKDFNVFREIILVSFGLLDIKNFLSDYIEESNEKEMLENMSAAERQAYERQQEILARLKKAKSKKEKTITESEDFNLSKIIIGVMKEFNLTVSEIHELNYFSLYHMFGYVFKIDHYEFMRQVAASGNLNKKTKITHWLE